MVIWTGLASLNYAVRNPELAWLETFKRRFSVRLRYMLDFGVTEAIVSCATNVARCKELIGRPSGNGKRRMQRLIQFCLSTSVVFIFLVFFFQ
jgi:hypothetical protein